MYLHEAVLRACKIWGIGDHDFLSPNQNESGWIFYNAADRRNHTLDHNGHVTCGAFHPECLEKERIADLPPPPVMEQPYVPEKEDTAAFIITLKPGQTARIQFYESDGQIDIRYDHDAVRVDTGEWPADNGQKGVVYEANHEVAMGTEDTVLTGDVGKVYKNL